MSELPKIFPKQCQSCPAVVLRARAKDKPPICFNCRREKQRAFARAYKKRKNKQL